MEIVVFKGASGDIFVNPENIRYFKPPTNGSSGTVIYFAKDDFVHVEEDPDMVSIALATE
jgi:hypothetical protein